MAPLGVGVSSAGDVAGPTRVLVVDDDALVRSALVLMLGGEADLEVVGEAADGREALARAAETRAHVVLSNPDMVHSGILPHHPRWAKLFENLQFVVIDELHAYRGVFGSHLCNVLRRLRRIAALRSARAGHRADALPQSEVRGVPAPLTRTGPLEWSAGGLLGSLTGHSNRACL